MTCADCRFQTEGHCRRYPPLAMFGPGPMGRPQVVSAWPPIPADGLCGEYKPTAPARQAVTIPGLDLG